MPHNQPYPADIVERLRCNYDGIDFSGPMQVVLPTAIMLEAAELIESLRKELQATEATLERTLDNATRLLSSGTCERHSEWINRISFDEFVGRLEELGCHWCMRDRIEALEKAVDYPEADGTDAAHPAWWRGNDAGSISCTNGVMDILTGKDKGRGVCGNPQIERMRGMLLSVVGKLDLLQKNQKYMRDPERTLVCDIIANGQLLPDPEGKRYSLQKIKGKNYEECNDCPVIDDQYQAEKRVRELEAIIGDVQAARRMKNIGPTGGGNPAMWYDFEAVEVALAGLGSNSEALTTLEQGQEKEIET